MTYCQCTHRTRLSGSCNKYICLCEVSISWPPTRVVFSLYVISNRTFGAACRIFSKQIMQLVYVLLPLLLLRWAGCRCDEYVIFQSKLFYYESNLCFINYIANHSNDTNFMQIKKILGKWEPIEVCFNYYF